MEKLDDNKSCTVRKGGVSTLSTKEATMQGQNDKLAMFGCMVEKVREDEVFSPEDTPLGWRVLAAFLYHPRWHCLSKRFRTS